MMELDPSCHALWRDLANLYFQLYRTFLQNESHRKLANQLARRRFLLKTISLEGNYMGAREAVKKAEIKIYQLLKINSQKKNFPFKKVIKRLSRKNRKLVHWPLRRELNLLILEAHHKSADSNSIIEPQVKMARQFLKQYQTRYPQSMDHYWIRQILKNKIP